MTTLLASIPDALRRRILAGLEQSFSFMDSADYKEAERAFEPFADMIELEHSEYLARHIVPHEGQGYLTISETDSLLEKLRIRRRVFEKYPGTETISSLLEDYALGHKKAVYGLKTEFFSAGGQQEQFDALLETAENNVSFRRKQARPPQAPGAPFIG